MSKTLSQLKQAIQQRAESVMPAQAGIHSSADSVIPAKATAMAGQAGIHPSLNSGDCSCLSLPLVGRAGEGETDSVIPAQSVIPLPVSLRGRSPKQSDSKNAGDCHQNSRSGKASKTGLIFGLSAGLIIFILLVLNLRVLYITRNYFANHKYLMEKLNNIEYLMMKDDQRMEEFSGQLKNLNLSVELVNIKIKSVQEQIDKLLMDAETHALAIENLSKAKDTLFKKVSSLENEIVILKTK